MRNEAPTKVIFDTDPGVDDAMAILFAHLSPDIDLIGLTTVFGNASIEQVTRNALLLRDRFAMGCPVHMGAGQALVRPNDEYPAMVHGDDGLGNTNFDLPEIVEPGDAADFIIDQVRNNPGEITLVAVGRMTNLATALRRAPDLAEKTKEVVIMGGVISSGGFTGNVTPVAEANIFGDPHAADEVMAAPWALTMVGLDVTLKTLVSPAVMEQLRDDGGDAGEFLYAVSRHYQEFYEERSGSDAFPMHDSLALAYCIDPDWFETRTGTLCVAVDGAAEGETIFADANRFYPESPWSRERPKQRVCVDVDADAVLDHYVATLLNAS